MLRLTGTHMDVLFELPEIHDRLQARPVQKVQYTILPFYTSFLFTHHLVFKHDG